MRTKRFATAAVVAVSLLGVACSSGDSATVAAHLPGDTGVGADGATAATVAPDLDQAGPESFLTTGAVSAPVVQRLDEAMTLSYLQRRFGGLVDLSWADQLVIDGLELLDTPAAEQFSFVRRFFDPAATPPEQLPPAETDGAVSTDAIVLYSLWCDRVELPDGYVDTLRATAETGGYDLTHGLGGVQLMIENGCLDEREGSKLVGELAPPTAALLDATAPADLELEACAILAWVGRWDLIPEDFAERVAAAQLPDGGWPLAGGDSVSDRHATLWGLRCALELEYGSQVGPARWIPT